MKILNRSWIRSGPAALVGAGLLLGCLPGRAQRAAAVPTLDLNQITGTWFQIARLPDKAEKKCVSDGTMLYALSDKPKSFQMGNFCKIKQGGFNANNSFGKQDKAGDGKLKVKRLVIFSTKYWVLAAGPKFEWALIGSPNHKSLWVLSRTPTLDAATLTQIESQASAQGFNAARLHPVAHTTQGYEAGPVASTM